MHIVDKEPSGFEQISGRPVWKVVDEFDNKTWAYVENGAITGYPTFAVYTTNDRTIREIARGVVIGCTIGGFIGSLIGNATALVMAIICGVVGGVLEYGPDNTKRSSRC